MNWRCANRGHEGKSIDDSSSWALRPPAPWSALYRWASCPDIGATQTVWRLAPVVRWCIYNPGLHLPSRYGGCVCKKTGTWRLCGPKPGTCSLRKGDVLNQTSCSRPSHVEGHRQWELGTSNRDLTVQYFPAQRSLLSASQTNKWTWKICYIKNLYPKAPCLEGVKNERIWF